MFKLFQFYDYDISKENRLDMLLSRTKENLLHIENKKNIYKNAGT
jgi:hypothetical protein